MYLDRRFHQGDAIAFDLPLRPVLQRLFAEHQSLVLFMPLGAAVRLLAPSLEHKHHDPAVVCVDDAGRFAVSLLSGHLGGADRLTEEVAAILGGHHCSTLSELPTKTSMTDLVALNSNWPPVKALTTATSLSVHHPPC